MCRRTAFSRSRRNSASLISSFDRGYNSADAPESESSLLIDTRLSACIAALYAGSVATWRIASILAHDGARLSGIHLFKELLPPYAQIALFLLVYGLMASRFVQALRECRGAERVYSALFFADLLLYPLRTVLPGAGATWVLSVQTFANLVMFPTAILIFLEAGSARRQQAAQRNP